MIFKTTAENKNYLLSIPESGVNYQIVTAKIATSYMKRRFLIINGEIIIEQDENETFYLKRLVQLGFDETKSTIKEQELLGIELISDRTKLNNVAELERKIDKSAKQNPIQHANGWMPFVRLSAFYDDVRIDRINKCLLPGSYTTTLADYFNCLLNKYDFIDRYALPNDLPIKWGFNIVPKASDSFQEGVVQPEFGKNGGGIECYFEKGTSFGTFTSEIVISI